MTQTFSKPVQPRMNLPMEQYDWLQRKACEDGINPAKRIELLVQKAKEEEEFVPERIHREREVNGPKFSKYISPWVQVRTSTWQRIEAMAAKNGWSTDAITELALQLMLKRK